MCVSGVGSERGERERSAFRLIAALAWGVFRLTIRTVLWFGLLSGGASNNIIHTDMYGQIDIEPLPLPLPLPSHVPSILVSEDLRRLGARASTTSII